ncbi:hypothetical protein GJR96_14370 [Haloferax sp. MBLA0076]|uniref:Uncharacterized protein n=1 Tax=Haloferax litoreum TaxID=2666140 RepID=A0A6A8GJH7_9EURY|nr:MULTISPECIES: hypothetical protein [Haloferax]MRX23136.1 hypothetical protein [Haloferax litoreum]
MLPAPPGLLDLPGPSDDQAGDRQSRGRGTPHVVWAVSSEQDGTDRRFEDGRRRGRS